MKLPMSLASLGLLGALVAGCGSDATTGGAGGASNAGTSNAGASNAGASNAGAPNGGASNGGASSAGTSSGGASNAGAPSAGAPNAGAPSAGASGQAGASGVDQVDPKDCAAVGASQKKLIVALSCKDTSAAIEETCALLYSSKFCTSQWEAMIECMNTKALSDFECDKIDKEIDLKSGVCTAEQTALNSCVGA